MIRAKFLITFFLLFTFACSHVKAESPYNGYISTDRAIIGAGIIGGLGTLYFRDRIEPLSELQIKRLDRNDINRFDRISTRYYSKRAAYVSDLGMGISIALPALFISSERMRRDVSTITYLYLETMAITGLATEIAKVTAKRIRPYAYNSEVPLQSKMALDTRKSFFSGHTSTSFAGAAFFAKVFSDYNPTSQFIPFVWFGALSLSSTVAYSRVKAGKHFPTDVIVAALVGSLAGYFVPEIHKKQLQSTGLKIESTSSPMLIAVNIRF
jgi:membrane-associated phospholipid phosphatase